MKSAFATGGYIDAADGSGHRVYYEAHGPADAPAFVMVHGNAGYLFNLKKISMWNLKKQRVIIIHARGVGASRPAGKIESNQYTNLADDIETVRQKLNLKDIGLVGWSGGAGVSLQYAEKYPAYCRSVILYGAFTGAGQELKAYYERSQKKYPQGWAAFCKFYQTTIPHEAVHRCNLDILNGAALSRQQAVIRYEEIFGPLKISPHDLAVLARNRMIYANMIENDFGQQKCAPVPPGALFIRGENDYIGTPRSGETIIKNAGHDFHDPRVQNCLKKIIAGLTAQFSSSPPRQPPQP